MRPLSCYKPYKAKIKESMNTELSLPFNTEAELSETMTINHLTLLPGQVHFWYALPAQINTLVLINSYVKMLSDDELDCYNRLQQQEHKLEYLVCHALIRSVLSQYSNQQPSEWRFIYNDHGKPSLLVAEQPQPLKFNIAHTNGMAVCAIAHEELGVDVEYHSDNQALLEMADHYFSAKEVEKLEHQTDEQQQLSFFRYWTLKEAYIKARGEGLQIPSSDFSFEFLEADEIIFTPPTGAHTEAADWSFKTFSPAPDYTAAVAVKSPRCSVQLFQAIPGQTYQRMTG